VAAVALPDHDLGERVCVFVVPRPGGAIVALDDLRRALTERGAAAYKLPERLEVVDTLPVTAVGKIDKNRLRSELARRTADRSTAGAAAE
jgi:2,3-dihydroxybenzoate-AMP ligase